MVMIHIMQNELCREALTFLKNVEREKKKRVDQSTHFLSTCIVYHIATVYHTTRALAASVAERDIPNAHDSKSLYNTTC